MDMNIKVIFETDHWLCLDKPVGTSVHNSKDNDLVSFVKHLQSNAEKAYPINRLDSGTCGLVLFAKDQNYAKLLQQMFEHRDVTKTYIARVLITKNPPKVGDEGLWKWPLTNRAEGRKDPKGYWGKRIPCKTTYKVLSLGDQTADLELNLLTGRKHQIRRHAAIQGWPILGDQRYGRQDEPKFTETLIAKRLEFIEPSTKEAIFIESEFKLP